MQHTYTELLNNRVLIELWSRSRRLFYLLNSSYYIFVKIFDSIIIIIIVLQRNCSMIKLLLAICFFFLIVQFSKTAIVAILTYYFVTQQGSNCTLLCFELYSWYKINKSCADWRWFHLFLIHGRRFGEYDIQYIMVFDDF